MTDEAWAVSGMTCAACAVRLEQVARRAPGVEAADVAFTTGLLTIRGAHLDVRAIVAQAGFDAEPATSDDGERAGSSQGRLALVRIAVAGAFAMQSTMIGLALVSPDLPADLRAPLGVLAGAVSAPAVLWAGAPLIRSTWRALRAGDFGVDGLVGLGTALLWTASWIAVAQGSEEVWFDTAAMLVALHGVGRALESRVRGRATSVVRALLSLAPVTALRLEPAGAVLVRVSALRAGDWVHVAPGERVPVDGVVRAGRSALDRALLTGESAPVPIEPGAWVEAGARNADGALTIEVVAAAGSRRIDEIAAAVREAVSRRPTAVKAADRVARFVVPTVGVLAAVAAVWQLATGGSLAEALVAGAAVVVVTCPCALTLAVPLAVAAAAGAAAERGVVFRDADTFDRLAQVTAVWFDKTGTLTVAARRLARVELAPGETLATALAVAGALAAAAPHPATAALARGATPAAGAQRVPGQGVEADLHGETWRLGRPGWASDAPNDADAIDLGRSGRRVARFVLGDELAPDAPEAVAALRALGLEVRVLSGDRQEAVVRIADAVGVTQAQGELSPEAKARALNEAARRGERIAFVGDGLNDGVALAAASVGVAPQGATDLASSAAGVILVEASLASLPEAIGLARRTRAVIRQNLAWALAYNVVAIPLAALGYATPLVAVAAMTASSLTVSLNAARLLGGR